MGLFLLLVFTGLFLGGYYLTKQPEEIQECGEECCNQNCENIARVLVNASNVPLITLNVVDRTLSVVDPCIQVISVCEYSEFQLFLLKSQEIYISSDTDHFVRSAEGITMIATFADVIYGVRDGRLYRAEGDFFCEWDWIEVDWAGDGIEWMSTTMTGTHLYTWNGKNGYLYSPNKNQAHAGNCLRVYGANISDFVEFSGNTGVIFPHQTKVSASFGMLDYYGSFFAGKMGHMGILDYMVYYF